MSPWKNYFKFNHLSLKNSLILSFTAHFILILLMTVKFVFFSSPIIDLSKAVRVDMVELPDKPLADILPEKPKDLPIETSTKPSIDSPIEKDPDNTHEKKSEPNPMKLPQKISEKKNEAEELKKVKLKQKSAFEKIKKISAIEKIKQELNQESNKKSSPQQPPIKGRALSAGTKVSGLDKIQSDDYLAKLDAQIKAHWTMPQWMVGKPFKATVWVKLNNTGSVISKKIIKSSGEPTYDEYCLLSIDKASPFPAVPEKFTEIYKNDGVTFAFPD